MRVWYFETVPEKKLNFSNKRYLIILPIWSYRRRPDTSSRFRRRRRSLIVYIESIDRGNFFSSRRDKEEEVYSLFLS